MNILNAAEKYKILFDSIDEGFCIIEMIFDEKQKPIDYRFLEINAAFERQTGMHDAVGKRMREFAPNHEEHWFEIYGKIALTGESLRFENRAEELHRWYDVYAFRFGNPKNMQVGILFNDVSARREMEEQLRVANKELEAFTYSASHDLRAPLRAVSSYASIFNEDYNAKLDEEGKKIIQTIKRNADRMRLLIDELLSFSKLGKQEVTKTDVDLYKLTEEVIQEINTLTPHNAKVDLGKLPTVKGDAVLLRQVIFNLVSNAVKYSSKQNNPVVKIAAEEVDDKIVISVKDNGAGFDMKYAGKLFGVFQRLHSQTDFEGTGVGLAIVERIINKHGGRVWAEGEVAKGATFYFALKKAA